MVIYDYEVAYGEDFALGRGEVRDRFLREVREGRCDGALSGAHCSTRSRARFAPGGPPPLRTRDHLWGRPGLSRRYQTKVVEHSSLILFGLHTLAEVSQAGGVGAAEHPQCAGVRPFPSIFATSECRDVVSQTGYEQVNFCQCAFGSSPRKPTTLACSAELRGAAWFGDRVCVHARHDPRIGRSEASGSFRTRQAQSYPEEVCLQVALMFVGHWSQVDACGPQDITFSTDEDSSDGDRVAVPEVGPCWDVIDRWRESARWTWRREEHNNLLEDRAALSAASRCLASPASWGRRFLIISDSQVVIGVFSKGRSSRPALNHFARKLAALRLGPGGRFYWRDVRTHRNHADAPSRGRSFGVLPVGPSAHVELPELFLNAGRG